MRGHHRRVLGAVVGAAALALVLAVPLCTGTSWATVGAALTAVPALTLAGLGVLWIAGLVCNSVALAASLPGLTTRRALALSLTGSAVANVLPLGGAAGVGLNYAMTRRWGFSTRSFTAYTATTNVCDVVAKLVVAAVASVLLFLLGPAAVLRQDLTALLVLGAVVPLLLVAVLHRPTAAVLGRALDRLVGRVATLLRRPGSTRLAEQLPWLAGTTTSLIRRRWRRLTVGTVCYQVLLVCLLWGCLHAAGLPVSLPLVVCALAVDRVLTMVPITPGGAGVVEGGMAVVLTALGADAGPAVAGVLLYRAFTYFAEIPVGGLTALVWSVRERGARAAAPERAG